jgi:hypothetical protein
MPKWAKKMANFKPIMSLLLYQNVIWTHCNVMQD